MGLFKSRPTHRAGARSFAAFKKVWIGQPFSECLSAGTNVWEKEYQDTLKKCMSGEPIDVLNNAIDVTMRHCERRSGKIAVHRRALKPAGG